MTIFLIIFAVGTLGIVFVSLHSAIKLRSYGFVRFFAFESIFALILYNAEYWLRDPFSVLQVISWVLLLGSIITVSSGFYMLRKFGKPMREVDDTALLVTTGIYRYIRHPLYGSLIFLAWGVFLKNISIFSFALVIVASGLSVAMAKIEETNNIRKFGDDYSRYIKTTKMFIPFII